MGVSVSLIIRFDIGDTSLHLKKWAKKSENHEIWANFDSPSANFWGAPKILKPVLDTPFQGLLLGKVWTTPTDLWSQRWGLGPPNFNRVTLQMLEEILTNTSTSNCLSSKGFLSVERP